MTSYRQHAPRCFVDPAENRDMHHLKILERFAIKGDPMPSEEQLVDLAKAHYRGDPLADNFVEEIRSMPGGGGMRMLETALRKGIEHVENPPQSLVTLFEEVDRQPNWLDPYMLKLGAEAYQRNTRIGISALTNVGLMGGYYASSVIKPLMYTGRLDYKADKRVAETTKFTVDVSIPGNMDRFRSGFYAAVKVRIMHAMARAMILRTDSWDNDEWGMPINQPGMLGTNLLFSYSYIQACRAYGCRFTALEEEAILHLWRYIGFLMGVEEHTLPSTMQQSARISYAISCVQRPPDEDSKALAQALHKVPLERANTSWERFKARIEMHTNAGATRLFMGPDVASALGLPGNATQWLIPLSMPVKLFSETLRMWIPGATKLAQKRGMAQRHAYVDRITKGKDNPYASVDKLKDRSKHAAKPMNETSSAEELSNSSRNAA